jgi:hypothetical protein
MRVPKLAKNGFYSSFSLLRPIWACLMGSSWRVEEWKIMGVSDQADATTAKPTPLPSA